MAITANEENGECAEWIDEDYLELNETKIPPKITKSNSAHLLNISHCYGRIRNSKTLYYITVVSLLLYLLLSTTNSKKCERSTWEGNRLFSN